MEDSGLISGEARFSALYGDFYGHILAYGRRRLPEPDARDLAAETFAVAWRRLDAATSGGLPWLYRTAHLTFLNFSRRTFREQQLVSRLASFGGDEPVSDVAISVSNRWVVAEALKALSPQDQELLLLVTWEDLDIRGAASVVGCSVGAAAVRVHRARARLRGHLEELGYDGERPVATSESRRASDEAQT